MASQNAASDSLVRVVLTRDEHVDDRLVALVESALQAICSEPIRYLDGSDLAFLRIQRDGGVAAVFAALREGFEARKEKGMPWEAFHLRFTSILGRAIFQRIGRNRLDPFIPHHNVTATPEGREWRVSVNALRRGQHGRVRFFFSRRMPKVMVDGKEKIVAFKPHVLEQVCDRVVPTWATYTGLGDAFALFDSMTRFDFVRLSDGAPALTFYDYCGSEGFFTHQFASEILGPDVDPSGYAYRIGYLPGYVSGEFFVARTLLPPVFAKTPERALLRNARISGSLRGQLSDFGRNNFRSRLLQRQDFGALKWFHDNGVQQVIKPLAPLHDYPSA